VGWGAAESVGAPATRTVTANGGPIARASDVTDVVGGRGANGASGPPLPTPRQLEFMELEMVQFMHFNVDTSCESQ
jgi:hypothetical protein